MAELRRRQDQASPFFVCAKQAPLHTCIFSFRHMQILLDTEGKKLRF
uniref:Uncharacterized protein n=1 Tax=Arundo donax TaxID=35708 RepID=A0A0A9AUQ4_ARUDO